LCQSIDDTREKIFFHHLNKFQEGVLANVFDTLDRLQHMFLQDRPDVVEAWYLRLDALVGRAETSLNGHNKEKARLLVLSDHGFARFDYKVHLNHWLVENHYLTLKNEDQQSDLSGVDWSRSQAYAIGLNSLYLNLKEREGQGSVTPDEIEFLRHKIRQDLMAWKGPDGRPVIQQVYLREEAFHGPLLPYAPDLLVGYSPGYRASAETGLGKWENASLVSNADHWHSDHCIDPQAVPGVLFANTSLSNYPQPSFRDIPSLAIGMNLEHSGTASRMPPRGDEEDQKTIEERLKGLGYL
jgi:predicted AlkP superfamily phosphohydrolase/phosphomutase